MYNAVFIKHLKRAILENRVPPQDTMDIFSAFYSMDTVGVIDSSNATQAKKILSSRQVEVVTLALEHEGYMMRREKRELSAKGSSCTFPATSCLAHGVSTLL